jgi:hypothetical protein
MKQLFLSLLEIVPFDRCLLTSPLWAPRMSSARFLLANRSGLCLFFFGECTVNSSPPPGQTTLSQWGFRGLVQLAHSSTTVLQTEALRAYAARSSALHKCKEALRAYAARSSALHKCKEALRAYAAHSSALHKCKGALRAYAARSHTLNPHHEALRAYTARSLACKAALRAYAAHSCTQVHKMMH